MDQVEKSCAKEVYQKIKNDILKVKIKDGDFLTLAELADKYNVSKTPVRDALSDLEREGYIVSLPRKGYLVKPTTQKNIRDFFEVRLILETSAAMLAIENADDDELEEIYKMALKFPENVERTDSDEFSSVNDEFHILLMKASHNLQLTEICVAIMEKISRILLQDSRKLDFINEKKEHVDIAKALMSREKKSAEKLIKNHILEVEQRVCGGFGRL